MTRLPKGRAKRSRSVVGVIKAFENAPLKRLSYSELKDQTGLAKQSLSNTLDELIQLRSVIKIIDVGDPQGAVYEFVELLEDERVDEAENSYFQQFEDIFPNLNPLAQIWQEANKKGVEFCREYYYCERTNTLLLGTYRLLGIKIEYYRRLIEASYSLKSAEKKESINSEEWKQCRNCIYCKRVQDKLLPFHDPASKKAQCTKNWLVKSGRIINELSDSCNDFEFRYPRS